MSDRVFTEGFPERWSMVHRDDCTLLVRRGDVGMFITPSQAICMAPKLMQGEAWLGTAKEIAHAMAGSREQELNRIFDEFCDGCGIGPPHDEQYRPQPNIRSVRTWTCDRCDHVNDRPKIKATQAPAPSSRGCETSVGMAMAAGIIMRCWGNDTYAREILTAAGLSSLADLQAAGVEQYDIDALMPALKSEGSE